ncbi:hypothetical protein BMS92_05365 [Leuconostoc mesenteroides subsp. mesenteroides]|nr:hypothetical protein BMS92_05365 [Leuconostoc mesenteroides subsp. mesenteroides]
MPFFVIKKGLVLLEWKYFPTPKILDPKKLNRPFGRFFLYEMIKNYFVLQISVKKEQAQWMI